MFYLWRNKEQAKNHTMAFRGGKGPDSRPTAPFGLPKVCNKDIKMVGTFELPHFVWPLLTRSMCVSGFESNHSTFTDSFQEFHVCNIERIYLSKKIRIKVSFLTIFSGNF